MMNKRTTAGFTLIEMLLAMAFVAFLMVTIALTTINMARTYQRGMTLSNVNSAGRAIITDLRRTISQAPASELKGSDDATQPPFTQKLVATGGAVCFGNYSYVWNDGAAIADPAKAGQLIKYQGSNQVIRLAKVLDAGKAECSGNGSVTPPSSADSTELLPSDDAANTSYDGLALQAPTGSYVLPKNCASDASAVVTVCAGPSDATQAVYNVSFTLGTNDASALELAKLDAPSCQPPSDSDSNLDYCAVNRFTFLVRAGGGTDETN